MASHGLEKYLTQDITELPHPSADFLIEYLADVYDPTKKLEKRPVKEYVPTVTIPKVVQSHLSYNNIKYLNC
jgi:hypothetical protein